MKKPDTSGGNGLGIPTDSVGIIVAGLTWLGGLLFGRQRKPRPPAPTYRCGELPTTWWITRAWPMDGVMQAIAFDIRTQAWNEARMGSYAAPWATSVYPDKARIYRDLTERLRPLVRNPSGSEQASDWEKLYRGEMPAHFATATIADSPARADWQQWRAIARQLSDADWRKWRPNGSAYTRAAMDFREEVNEFLSASRPWTQADIDSDFGLVFMRDSDARAWGAAYERMGNKPFSLALRDQILSCSPVIFLSWPAEYTLWEAGSSGRIIYARLSVGWGEGPEGTMRVGAGHIRRPVFQTLNPDQWRQISTEFQGVLQ